MKINNRLFVILLAFICLISLVKNSHKKFKTSKKKVPDISCTVQLITNGRTHLLNETIGCNLSNSYKTFTTPGQIKSNASQLALLEDINYCQCTVVFYIRSYIYKFKEGFRYTLNKDDNSTYIYNSNGKKIDKVEYRCGGNSDYKARCSKDKKLKK